LNDKNKIWQAARRAIPYVTPMLVVFLFIGTTYGLYMRSIGFSPLYPMLMSLLIYAGSMEFVAANLLLGDFDLINAIVLTLLVNGRHIFYGVSMLQKYAGAGAKKLYMILFMADETFAINYTTKIPKGTDKYWFYFFVTLYLHMFWFFGATLGALGCDVIGFDLTGIDFAMTALFIVIFVSQWQQERVHDSAVLGIITGIVSVLIFGSRNFMLPFMIAILIILMAFRKKIERKFDNK
jgi:4-azaleucine resistance transporter AzlC